MFRKISFQIISSKPRTPNKNSKADYHLLYMEAEGYQFLLVIERLVAGVCG